MFTNPFNLARPDPVSSELLANNGNPNTVYNTTSTPFQNTTSTPMHNAAAVGAVLPQLWANTPAYNVNASPFQQPVSMPQSSAYANPASQFWTRLGGTQRPVFNLSTSGAVYPNTPWVSPPATETPIVETPTGSGGDITGTPTVPSVGGRGSSPESELNLGGGSLGPGAWGPGVITVGTGGDTFLDTGSGTLRLNPINSIMNGLNDVLDSAMNGLGFNGADGRFDFNQFLDAITEAFLPGDLYNANVGSWNSLNIATSLLNAVFSIPGTDFGLGNFAQWLIDKLPEGNFIRQWMQQNVVQNNADEAKDPDSYLNVPQTTPGDRAQRRRDRGGGGGGGGGSLGGGSWGGGGTGGFSGIVNVGRIQKV